MRSGKILDYSNLKLNEQSIFNACGKKKFIAVVKANAYGHGIAEASRHLDDRLVLYYAVSSLDEALTLRKIKSSCDILILTPLDKDEVEIAIENRFALTIASSHSLNALLLAKNHKYATVHIKVDVGMNRYGFKSKPSVYWACKKLCEFGVKVEGIYTHLPQFANNQITKFITKFSQFCNVYNFRIKHIGGSGILNYDGKLNYDITRRIGLALYGFNLAAEKRSIKLGQVLKIQSKILEIKNIKKGEAVGYDGDFIAEHDCKIAVCKFGYADGISKNLEGKDYLVKIRGKWCKIVGKICMDCFFVLLESEGFEIGDDVLLVEDFEKYSKCADLFLYEALTNFNKLRNC